jgi:hypothetical protein
VRIERNIWLNGVRKTDAQSGSVGIVTTFFETGPIYWKANIGVTSLTAGLTDVSMGVFYGYN